MGVTLVFIIYLAASAASSFRYVASVVFQLVNSPAIGRVMSVVTLHIIPDCSVRLSPLFEGQFLVFCFCPICDGRAFCTSYLLMCTYSWCTVFG